MVHQENLSQPTLKLSPIEEGQLTYQQSKNLTEATQVLKQI